MVTYMNINNVYRVLRFSLTHQKVERGYNRELLVYESVYLGKYWTATTFSAVPTCPSLFMTDEVHSQLLKLVTTMSL